VGAGTVVGSRVLFSVGGEVIGTADTGMVDVFYKLVIRHGSTSPVAMRVAGILHRPKHVRLDNIGPHVNCRCSY